MCVQAFRNTWLVWLALAIGACSGETGPSEPAASAEGQSIAAIETADQTIVVFGASGKIGSLIVSEALDRGHNVIGVSRSPEKFTINHVSFSAVKGDVTSADSFKEVTHGADAVIISVHGSSEDNAPENTVHAKSASIAAEVLSNVDGAPYVLQIGGATTMFETKEAMLENLPFRAEEGTEIYGMLFGHLVALDSYRASDIDWTVLTPPRMIKGWSPTGLIDRTKIGSYRTSTTGIIMDKSGAPASIMVADLAAAAVDEIEKRQFIRQRFTVAN